MDVVVVVLVIGLCVALMILSFGRARKILGRWAEANDLRIVSAERRSFRRGPFFWTTGKSQVVFWFTAVGAEGARLQGFARVGSRWLGLWSDKVEVHNDQRGNPDRERLERVFE